jgi:hypothetical protein
MRACQLLCLLTLFLGTSGCDDLTCAEQLKGSYERAGKCYCPTGTVPQGDRCGDAGTLGGDAGR